MVQGKSKDNRKRQKTKVKCQKSRVKDQHSASERASAR